MSQLPWCIQHWTGLKDATTLVVSLGVASVALYTYWLNARTKRAEFLASLHKSFFVEDTYKKVREALDEDMDQGEEKRKALVKADEASFTDFLNFFELVAYFRVMGAYKEEDVKALLGYYLRLLKQSPSVYAYICNQENDFEHLKALLGKVEL